MQADFNRFASSPPFAFSFVCLCEFIFVCGSFAQPLKTQLHFLIGTFYVCHPLSSKGTRLAVLSSGCHFDLYLFNELLIALSFDYNCTNADASPN